MNRLMERFQGHFWCIENKSENDVAQHFNEPKHKGIEEVKIHILDFIHRAPRSEEAKYTRDHIEMNWVHRLHTQQPLGMNTMDTPPRYGPYTNKGWTHLKR